MLSVLPNQHVAKGYSQVLLPLHTKAVPSGQPLEGHNRRQKISTPLNYGKKRLQTFTDYKEPTKEYAPVVRVACLIVLRDFTFVYRLVTKLRTPFLHDFVLHL